MEPCCTNQKCDDLQGVDSLTDLPIERAEVSAHLGRALGGELAVEDDRDALLALHHRVARWEESLLDESRVADVVRGRGMQSGYLGSRDKG